MMFIDSVEQSRSDDHQENLGEQSLFSFVNFGIVRASWVIIPDASCFMVRTKKSRLSSFVSAFGSDIVPMILSFYYLFNLVFATTCSLPSINMLTGSYSDHGCCSTSED